jgi:hypothetical protein
MAVAINELIATRPEISSVPASATAPGKPGQIAFDSEHFYACVSANVWRRTAWEIF